MSNKNYLSKSSQYVQSLVDFILDTKPYHSKLTEIVEEYQFFDDVNVKFTERMLIKTKIAATWSYNFFSQGNPLYRTMPAQRVVSPIFRRESFSVGSDENKDIALVPYAYSQKKLDGVGVNQVFVRRSSGNTEPMTESVDYFQSHGAFQFQIKQTVDANNTFNPLWTTTADDGVIAASRTATISNALNQGNYQSNVNQIRRILDEVQLATTEAGGDVDVQNALNALFTITNTPALPRSYEDLFAYLGINTLILVDREALKEQLDALSPSLYFGTYSDMGLRDTGAISYADTSNAYIKITNIIPNVNADFEEWTVEAVDNNTTLYKVVGSASGFIGFLNVGGSFTHPRISFQTTQLSQAPAGSAFSFRPINKIVIDASAPLETWSMIKVNPIAHNRPVLKSVNYGHIEDVFANLGYVTLLDQTLPTGTVILTARADGVTFDLTSDVESSYTRVVNVGAAFNDGRLAFTVVAGAQKFFQGDRFYISIENLPAEVLDLDLGYGYDLDPYDDETQLYNNTDSTNANFNQAIGFYYDGRFTNFDLNTLGLVVSQAAIDSRRWRVRALPGGTQIATLKKDGSGPDYRVDLANATSGMAPDPALNAIAEYSMPGDSNPGAEDLNVYYGTQFSVEYSDDDFHTSHGIGNITVGNQFVSVLHGIQFTLAAASRPYVAVTSDEGVGQPRVAGGDVFSWKVRNPLPTLSDVPISLTSSKIPRLIMHSDSFYDAPDAKWAVTFSSPTTYTITGLYTSGVNYGQPVSGTPVSCLVTTRGINALEGLSYRGLGIHFTIVPGNGLTTGDVFNFETYLIKPSYLVHGSITGFTKPAVVGTYYWNGFIGFKITKPVTNTYVANNISTNSGITVTYLREDCPSVTYIFDKTSTGYLVTRSDVGVVGYCPSSGTFSDKYASFSSLGVTASQVKVDVNATSFELFNTADLVIIDPKQAPRLPAVGEKVVIEKTEESRMGINLVPGITNISALAPITIDQRFIDLNTNSSIPVSNTSPETALLSGWLPITTTKWDSATSLAEFSDPAVLYTFNSAANAMNIGTLSQQDPTNLNEPIIFTWDTDFYNAFLPLNAEANLVITGTGWDDEMRVRVTESIKFLIDGGGLTEDFLFHDDMNIVINDDMFMNIVTNYNTNVEAAVSDGPFSGFQFGYDNDRYDINGYDLGQPPNLASILAASNLTPQQVKDAYDRWNNFLLGGIDVQPTTQAQWAYLQNGLINDPSGGGTGTTDLFGYPAAGLGMDITQHPDDGVAAASIQEAMVVLARDIGNTFDLNGYDVGPLDSRDEATAIIYSGSLPPIPTAVPAGSTYESLDTPLEVLVPSRIFDISFNASPAQLAALNPVFSIWFPLEPAPQQVPVVERISAGTFRFSITRPSEAKIIVG